MGAGVEKNSGPILHLSDVLHHPFEIDSLRLGIEIAEQLEWEVRVPSDVQVVGPSWVRDVNGHPRLEPGEELEPEPHGTSAR